MPWSHKTEDAFSIALAVLTSIGGGGVIIFALSSWLGKVWASRILEREKAELTRSIEATRADLMVSIEREKAAMAVYHERHKSELNEVSAQRIDTLNRKKDVYSRLATTMRVFLRASKQGEQVEKDKMAFLAAYDEGYLWASEAVAAAIRDFITTIEQKTAADQQVNITAPNTPG